MRRLAAVSLIVLAAALLSACGGSSEEGLGAEEAVKPGESPGDAIARLTEAIEADDRDIRALNSRGRVYYGLGRYDKAVEDFGEAVFWQQHAVSQGGSKVTEQEFAELFRDLGLAQFKMDDFDAAIDSFGNGIAADRRNPQLFYDRGLVEFTRGNYRAAILTDGFDAAIKLDAEFTDAYVKRGIAYTLLGDDEDAQRDIDKAVALGADREAIQNEIVRLEASQP